MPPQSRTSTPVKTGVIGWGRFGRLHSLTLASLAEAELVAVVARRPESLEAMSRELPAVRGWLSRLALGSGGDLSAALDHIR